jgi:hypothetical protein
MLSGDWPGAPIGRANQTDIYEFVYDDLCKLDYATNLSFGSCNNSVRGIFNLLIYLIILLRPTADAKLLPHLNNFVI